MIGFLIINYNDAKTTEKLLKNVKDYHCLDKILVVDNNSTDDSYEYLKKYDNEKIEILRRVDGREFGAGINYGLRYLKSLGVTHTFISNSDIEIDKESDLETLIGYRDKAIMIGPVIREHTGYNRGWKVPTNFQLLLSSIPFFYRFFVNKNRYTEDYYQGPFISVEVISFCFFFVSILDLERVGYLDEKVFLYFEENIMSCKLKRQGLSLCNEVEVFHNHSVTINKNLKRARKYLALSKSRRYFAKNYNHANPIILCSLWTLEKMSFLTLSFLDLFH